MTNTVLRSIRIDIIDVTNTAYLPLISIIYECVNLMPYIKLFWVSETYQQQFFTIDCMKLCHFSATIFQHRKNILDLDLFLRAIFAVRLYHQYLQAENGEQHQKGEILSWTHLL